MTTSPQPRAEVPAAVTRFESVLLGLFAGVWLLAVLAFLGVPPLAGAVGLDLYHLYSVAAILGWIGGNVYVTRLRRLPGRGWRKRLLLAYLVGPAGFVYLLRAMAPRAELAAAPLVPIYGFGVFALFFLVPVSLRTRARRR